MKKYTSALLLAFFFAPLTALAGSFTSMAGTDTLTASRGVINANFGNALSTSTAATVGNLLYFSGVQTVANVATSTLTATSPITVSNSPNIIGASGAVIACSSCSSFQWPFTQQTSFTGVSTSTLIGFLGGLMSTGSSTIQYFNSASSTISVLAIPSLTDALMLTNGNGVFAEYAGSSCTNQFVRSLDALGAATCATVGTADVSGLDISDDTNLAGTYPIILTGDTLSFPATSTLYANLSAGALGINTAKEVYTHATTTYTGTSPLSFSYASGVMTGSCSTCATFGYPFTSVSTYTGVSTSTLINFGGGAMSNASSTFQNLLVGTITGTGLADFGGGVLEIPNDTAPVCNDVGEICHDTTDNMILVDDFVIGKATNRIWGVTIASTSPYFIAATNLAIPTELDGYTMTAIRCYVVSGTSKAIIITDGTNATESITCATTVTSDDGSITNAAVTAGELMYLDFGSSVGTPDTVSVAVFGQWTRE